MRELTKEEVDLVAGGDGLSPADGIGATLGLVAIAVAVGAVGAATFAVGSIAVMAGIAVAQTLKEEKTGASRFRVG